MRTAVVGLGNPEGLPELDLGLGNVDRLLLGEEDVGRGTLGVSPRAQKGSFLPNISLTGFWDRGVMSFPLNNRRKRQKNVILILSPWPEITGLEGKAGWRASKMLEFQKWGVY